MHVCRLSTSENKQKVTTSAGIVDPNIFQTFLNKLGNFTFFSTYLPFSLGLEGLNFFDAGSGTGSLSPMVLKAGFASYTGIEFHAATAALSINTIATLMETDKNWKKCLDRISIVVGNILKLALLRGGKVAFHSYLGTMELQYSMNVHIIGLVARSLCIASWIFHSRELGSVLQLLTILFDSAYRPPLTRLQNSQTRDGEEDLFKNLVKNHLPFLTRHVMPNISGDGCDVIDEGSAGYMIQVEYVYHLPISLKVRLKMRANLDQLHKAMGGKVRNKVTIERDGLRVSAGAHVVDFNNLSSVTKRLETYVTLESLENHLTTEAVAAGWMDQEEVYLSSSLYLSENHQSTPTCFTFTQCVKENQDTVNEEKITKKNLKRRLYLGISGIKLSINFQTLG